MALVENNIVKMEWEKSGWLATKAKAGKNGAFIFASKNYESSSDDYDTITVFFNADTAWIWASDAQTDEEDLWDETDLKSWVKTNYDGSFPYMYDEYIPVIVSGGTSCELSILERYGLTEYKDDIEARLRDLVPFGEEKILTM